MKPQVLIGASALLGSALVAAQTNETKLPVDELFRPTRYIVEFSDVGSAKFRKRDGTPDTDEFVAELQGAGSDVDIAFSYTSEIFHGASLEFANATEEDIEQLQSLPEVKNVWPEAYITLGIDPEEIEILDSPTNLTFWDPHRETNVSRVHDLDHLGEGVIVAVVDSGIDYTHPALGGGLGAGFKVESGWDFVGNSPDPKDCFGHGTHVAGIIGADDEFLKGVAPKARLRGYKIFGCTDGTTEGMAIAAFLRAYEDGADVINGSLGSSRGFPESAIAVVLSRIQAQGVMVVAAAGNSGNNGPFFTTDLGNNFGGLTVGSIEHDALAAYEVTAHSTSGESRKFVYVSSDLRPFNLSGNVSASWVEGDTREFHSCWVGNPIPTIPDENLIVLPRDPVCQWQSHDNRLNNKVDWVFWWNFEDAEYTVPSRIMYDPEIQPKGSAVISYQDGDWLVSQHEDGHNLTYIFNATSAPLAAERPSLAGGRLNDFSSWGPTIDARLKPEVAAPGGSIYNTWLDGTWTTISGTSMAAPYVAGLSALVLEAHGTRSERDDAAAYARSRIITSARSIKHPDGSDSPASIAQQGTGLVDAVKAVRYSTSVNPPNIHLNDTDHFEATHEIQVTNNGEEQVTYRLSHTVEPTFFSRNVDTDRIDLQPARSSEPEDAASVELSTTDLVVGPGETANFEVTFKEPSADNTARFPVYGGAIAISGDNGEDVRVVYMGIHGSINNFTHWGGDSRPFLNENGESMVDGETYSFNSESVPYAPFMITWSTNEASIDFVDRNWAPENWAWPPVPGENNFRGHFRTTGDGTFFVVTDFPLRRFPRAATQWFARPTATFAHGEQIVDGEYRYLRRSLKTFGDPQNIDDWQWDLSAWFRVERG
ncbi:subtilisin-like serine protease pr1c [Fusarium albosuccineum]|uniref:Subtilisin-like serine protease pr1c n=1 Tax=Fusarium albosuccineum TaxID=1237068 RepID=A0A8H4L6H5_9HYPO|nr:subtilisin-like serine protease pr1c [Fusarium albosuccineum]